ncbi:unnamed protein product [Adineta ricciae]|uniref:Tyrosine aminotransferase n=1 Tax=Adineta ricciae TaxID=249248 RepID=A0A815EN58_ADIRI|nr:unnamed protein product [Adineta ricciae]CAF1313765.1 unnamed protein product [Adineta ricciae]
MMQNGSTKDDNWQIKSSQAALATSATARWMASAKKSKSTDESVPSKSTITLSIGELLPPTEARAAIVDAIQESSAHGYAISYGNSITRQAVAEFLSDSNLKFTIDDIIMTSGCNQAIETCFTCLADPGDNILIPRSSFSLFDSLCAAGHIEPRFYNLRPDKGWEIDFEDLKKKHRRANTSCSHQQSIKSMWHYEIYAGMTFEGVKFHATATLSERVPVLTCGGISKLFCCPGWRCGWIAIHDPMNYLFDSVRPCLFDLSVRLLGPNSIIQAALPRILNETPKIYFKDYMAYVQKNAELMFDILSQAQPTIEPHKSQGALYMLIRINPDQFDGTIENEIDFAKKLMDEQAVSCVPCTSFGISNYCRLVTVAPFENVRDACERIVEFCHKYQKKSNGHTHNNNNTE